MDHDTLRSLQALTDAARLRLVGRLAGGPATTDQLVRELGMPIRSAVRHLELLRDAGVVTATGDPPRRTWAIRIETLQRAGRHLAQLERSGDVAAPGLEGPDGEPLPPEEARVLRAFIPDGRVTTIPAQAGKRLVLLRWLRDRVFTEDRGYPEKEVNQRLALFHPDVASLRRYMVDAGLVRRDGGIYRRSD